MTASHKYRAAVVFLALAAIAVTAFFWLPKRNALVVYCAHDALYAEEILRRFEEQTGIPVEIRFDTEATKSLGLVELILRERESPRCDVFWNNQVVGTMDLKDAGILVPYRGSGHARIPDQFKDAEGYWTGFAARMRVIVGHEDRIKQFDAEKQDLFAGDLSRVAVAKPLYGTTFTHFALLWSLWGPEQLRDWFAEIRDRKVRVVGGNATVKNLVAAGVCELGWTDTDDVFVGVDAGEPLDMIPVRVQGKTICIPNSVAIIRDTDRLTDAQRLVDYLLSAETEVALSRSKSRQIPLGPVPRGQLSEEVQRLSDWAQDAHSAVIGADARRGCLAWLKEEYAP